MISHEAQRLSNRFIRTTARAGVIGLLAAATLAAGPAFADTPAAWEKEPSVSGFQFMLVLVLIPAGIGLIIALLVSLPSLMHRKGYQPGQAWHGEPEWFGGPRQGIQATDAVTPAELTEASKDTGGISAQW